MNIKNARSNPLYHFIEVSGTNDELNECSRWCTETFGLAHDHNWGSERIRNADTTRDVLRRLSSDEYRYRFAKVEYRYRFAKVEHRDWFLLRWS